MEFITSNKFDTTSGLSVNSATLTADNIFTRDLTFQYISEGFNDDTLTSTLVYDFGSTITVSRLALMGHNIKAYNMYYDGVTANAFSFTATSSTITSQFISNSETSQFFKCSTVSCQTISFDLKSTQVANSEKAVGFFYAGDSKLDFERTPSSKNYTPNYKQKQIVHTLSDGGVRLQHIAEKFDSKIKFSYITESFRTSLRSVFNEKTEFFFLPFGTSTGWDEIFHEVNWVGNFDFYKYSDNAQNSGFSGSILLKET